MKTKKIDAYKANARDNAGKTRNAAEITNGDFLYMEICKAQSEYGYDKCARENSLY